MGQTQNIQQNKENNKNNKTCSNYSGHHMKGSLQQANNSWEKQAKQNNKDVQISLAEERPSADYFEYLCLSLLFMCFCFLKLFLHVVSCLGLELNGGLPSGRFNATAS